MAQYTRRLGQITTTLSKAGALSEDALIGFARLYKRLVKDAPAGNSVAIRERVRDLTDLFDTRLANLDSNLSAQEIKGAKALAKSLEDYKVRSEAAGFDGKFWFKDVETVYTDLYHHFPVTGFNRLEVRNGTVYLTEFGGDRGVVCHRQSNRHSRGCKRHPSASGAG